MMMCYLVNSKKSISTMRSSTLPPLETKRSNSPALPPANSFVSPKALLSWAGPSILMVMTSLITGLSIGICT